MTSHRYDDIIGLAHPDSLIRPRMSARDRAAQFSPFAALTGLEAMISETGRLTEERIELDEDGKAALDNRLRRVQENVADRPKILVTYFCPDERKAGGAYLCAEGQIKKIDSDYRRLIFTDGRAIPLDDIYALEGALFSHENEETDTP